LIVASGAIAAALAQGSQRRADGWQDYFGPSPFITLLAWLALSTAGGLLLAIVIDALGLNLATSVETVLILLVNVACYIGLIQVLVIRPGALSWSDMARPQHLAPDRSDWDEPSNWGVQAVMTRGRKLGRFVGDVALGFGLAIPFLIGTLILAFILTTLLGMDKVTYEGPVTVATEWDLWVLMLSVAILAPLGEELFFRGFATNAWARSLSRKAAIPLAALFFASIHVINVDITGHLDLSILVRGAFLAVATRIPVAWGLAWIYTRRRSIWASAALHGTYNGCLILLAWWAVKYQYP
jgi:membrane protease YdiL (CAAX protease family)